jgi:hypothetical protein
MNVVGIVVVARTVTVLTPVAGSTDDEKKLASVVGSVVVVVPR